MPACWSFSKRGDSIASSISQLPVVVRICSLDTVVTAAAPTNRTRCSLRRSTGARLELPSDLCALLASQPAY